MHNDQFEARNALDAEVRMACKIAPSATAAWLRALVAGEGSAPGAYMATRAASFLDRGDPETAAPDACEAMSEIWAAACAIPSDPAEATPALVRMLRGKSDDDRARGAQRVERLRQGLSAALAAALRGAEVPFLFGLRETDANGVRYEFQLRWRNVDRGDVEPVSYASGQAPPNYVCGVCGATGCKLWRRMRGQPVTLSCATCSEAAESAKLDDAHPERLGDLVYAIPDEDGMGFWLFPHQPKAGTEWWMALPTRPAGALAGSR